MYNIDMQTSQNAITIKPKSMRYHRNGVSGIGFYALTFDWKNHVEGAIGKNFLATFESDENDYMVKYESCRVIDLADPLTPYRGDVFGIGINEYLINLRIENRKHFVYDSMEAINKK